METIPQTKTHKKRWSLITWLFIPLIIAWISTNYIIGILRPPSWTVQTAIGTTQQVNADTTKLAAPTAKFAQFYWQGTGLITLWFDDTWITQYTVAYPLVASYKYHAALAVPTKLVGYDAYMSWPQIKRLQTLGWEITSHTRNHSCTMNKANNNTVESEIGGALLDLKAQGLDAKQYVSPCGVDTPYMKSVAKKYYLSYRTSQPGFNTLPVTDPYNLKVQTLRNTVTRAKIKSWIQEAQRTHTWLILMFHQIDDSKTEYSISVDTLKYILSEIKKADLPVVVPSQAFELVDGSEISITPTINKKITPEL